MQAPTTQTVYELFNGKIQFQVPVYQRAYVWNEDEHWGLLWEDVAASADQFMCEPENQPRAKHFLGPIVLSQEHFEASGIDPRLVIDGQQRLTTIQLLLSAAGAVAAEHGVAEVAEELFELTENRGSKASGDLRFKLLPSRRDRNHFLATIVEGSEESNHTGIPGAWAYFRDRVEEWSSEEGDAGEDRQRERLVALQTSLESLLYVVAINLDQDDNAQVIFETLNARGAGLGALDLVKNATFLKASREKEPSDTLHDEYWEPTFEDDDYWLEEIRQGRDRRPRADWFLMHWLAMELGRTVRADKLFDTFRKDILHAPDAPPVTELVPRICADARIMRSFDDFEEGTAEKLFFDRLEVMDTTTMLPIALFLFRTDELSSERRLQAMRALESWLVRRGILRLTSRNYNRTIAAVLVAMQERPGDADEALIEELRSSEANTFRWPSDEEIRERLEQGELYGVVGRGRVRMLLEACEFDLRKSTKTEVIGMPTDLSIEHALPQGWPENWPVPASEDPEAAEERRAAHVNRLGNLTLVTQPLNSSLSNAPWTSENPGAPSKREELRQRSVLLINQRLCDHKEWDEALIDGRGAELAGRILATWPGPESEVWPRRGDPDSGAAEAKESSAI